MKSPFKLWFAASTLTALAPLSGSARPAKNADSPAVPPTFYRTAQVDGLNIFYREAGPEDAPVIVLLHGFPTSSRMFRNLIPALADRYHLIAPDYPGFGHSSAPSIDQFSYTFDHLAQVMDNFVNQLGLTKYSLYVKIMALRSVTASLRNIPSAFKL